MKLAVDAMGGDFAPQSIVEGVERARDEDSTIQFTLYGDEKRIREFLKDDKNITIVHTDEEIDGNDEPVKAIRSKKKASMVLAAQSVKDGENDAVFSCGNTGALLAAGLFIIGRIKGIPRPGLLATLPVISSDNTVNLLDAGANADSKPEHLHQYAVLGNYYAKNVRHISNPKIGLLNNGTEPHKGNKVTQEAYQLLQNDTELNFVGNIESNDLLSGKADIVVSDGFTGNAVLKSVEGTALGMFSLLKSAIMSGGLRAKIGALLLKPSLKQLKNKMDSPKYGGAVLLGIKAPVVKSHGSSKAEVVYYTINQINDMVNTDVVPNIVNYFEKETSENKIN
ncbi:phosphate acyltransferase PlsX [Dellaglioa sp. P0083]|uniref:phosphate acyltransferase PlsX n=1 Tax=Dellaglioa kimchii TaxID=3344667 RepID=UPI0038D4847B